MKFSSSTQKTPVADVLGGDRDEGLESTPIKEIKMNSPIVSAATATRLDFDGLTVDVDPISDHLEVTITSSTRTTFGLALTPTEARKLAEALLDGSAPAFGQAPLEEVQEHVRVATKATVAMTPAKFAKQMREAN